MPKKTPKTTWQAIGMVSGLGIQMVACVVVGLIIGKAVDRWLGSGPWFAVGGIVVGMLTGLWSVWRMVRDTE